MFNESNTIKTVFFGPFIGEFGWELAYWHGWVKRMCREKYQSYKKIAASYPGREPFYPDIDEFWPHPSEINKLRISQKNYITDFWTKNNFKKKDFDGNIKKHLENLLRKYQKILPKDTILYVPFKLNTYQLKNQWYLFGVLSVKRLPSKIFSINFSHQIFEELKPTQDGEAFLKHYFKPDKRIIAVFPRYRLVRREDKNWPKEKYDLLIKNLKEKYPHYLIGIFGAPGGVYYEDKIPLGCLDFIHLDEKIRFNCQLAALKKADIAIGGVSGALLVALLAKCPVVEWGHGISKEPTHRHNFLNTRLIYWPEVNPSVNIIENLIEFMLEGKEKDLTYPKSSTQAELGNNDKYFFKKMIDFLRFFIREIIAKIYLFYILNIKKLREGLI